MASGQIFGLTACPPGQKYAVEDTFAATTTATGGPYEVFPMWSHDAATGSVMHFYGAAVGYGNGGFTLAFSSLCTTTATTTVVWGAALRNISDGTAITGAHTYDYNFATDAMAGTVAVETQHTITFSDGADADSVGNLDDFVLALQRNATATGDAVTVNVYVLQGSVVLKET